MHSRGGSRHALPRLGVAGEMQKPSALHDVKVQRNDHAVDAMLEKVSFLTKVQIKTITLHLIIRE